MTRNELIAAMAEKADVSKEVAGRVLGMFMESVMAEVAAGGEVVLIGFGKFSMTERREREGRSPGTGEPIIIPAARIPKFTAGKEFKLKVSQPSGSVAP
jgi:DNA-binding protein HU-beta